VPSIPDYDSCEVTCSAKTIILFAHVTFTPWIAVVSFSNVSICAVFTDFPVVFPNFAVLFPYFAIIFPYFAVLLPNFAVLFPYFAILFPYFTVLLPNFAVLFPYFAILFPYFAVLLPNFAVLLPNFAVLFPISFIFISVYFKFQAKSTVQPKLYISESETGSGQQVQGADEGFKRYPNESNRQKV
jgi:hypothetical protein